MAHPRAKRILYRVVDCFGDLWDVTESLPTEYSWNILAGYPSAKGERPKVIKGPARIILTPELRACLEEFRMKRGKVNLPLGSTTICKLRRKLGMNYWNDCKAWWKETKNTEISDEPSLRNDAPLKPRNLTWTRNEITQVSKMLRDGGRVVEIARIFGKHEKAVFMLRQKLFGKKVYRWSPQEEEQLLEGVRNKLPLPAIAENLGRSLSSVKGKIVALRKRERNAAKGA